MAYDPNQLTQGGSGGIKGSASANPSGFRRALPNESFIEGEFKRVNDKAIGPAKRIAPKATSGLGKVLGPAAAGTELFYNAVSGFGSTPGDQRLNPSDQPAFGKGAVGSERPTDPKAELAIYQRDSAARLAKIPGASNIPSSTPSAPTKTSTTPTPVATSSTDPTTLTNKIGNVTLTQTGTGPEAPTVFTNPNRLGVTSPNPDSNGDGVISGSEQFQSQYGGNVDKPTLVNTAYKQSINDNNYQTPNKPGDYTGGKLKIDLGNDRGGTIQFADGRTLSKDRLASLNNQVEFNQRESTQNSFARNAQLTAQREEAARSKSNPLGQIGTLLNQARAAYAGAGSVTAKAIAGHRLRDLEKIALETKGIDSENYRATLAAQVDARNHAGEAAFKGQQEDAKQDNEALGKIVELKKTASLDTPSAVSILRSKGKPISYGNLGFLLDPADFEAFNSAKSDGERQAILDSSKAFSPSETAYIINDFNKQRLGQ